MLFTGIQSDWDTWEHYINDKLDMATDRLGDYNELITGACIIAEHLAPHILAEVDHMIFSHPQMILPHLERVFGTPSGHLHWFQDCMNEIPNYSPPSHLEGLVFYSANSTALALALCEVKYEEERARVHVLKHGHRKMKWIDYYCGEGIIVHTSPAIYLDRQRDRIATNYLRSLQPAFDIVPPASLCIPAATSARDNKSVHNDDGDRPDHLHGGELLSQAAELARAPSPAVIPTLASDTIPATPLCILAAIPHRKDTPACYCLLRRTLSWHSARVVLVLQDPGCLPPGHRLAMACTCLQNLPGDFLWRI